MSRAEGELLTIDLNRTVEAHDIVLSIVVVPDFIKPYVPREDVALEDNFPIFRIFTCTFLVLERNRNVAIPLVVMHGHPHS